MEVSYTRSLPVKYTADVFVAGGGPAGLAAAISCARQGRSVFLAESYSALGGAAVTMLVPMFMDFTDGVHFLAGGFGQEVYDAIKREALPKFRRFCPKAIPAETLKIIYDDMVTEAGVQFLFHTNVMDAVVENGKIQYVVCAAKGSTFAVKANIYIDCTGDGDLSYYAGAGWEYGDENGRTMATTLCGLWTAIDWSRVVVSDKSRLDDAFADNVFTNKDRHLVGIKRIMEESKDANGVSVPNGFGGSNAGHIYDVDARYSESLTEGLIKGRKQLLEFRRYYKEYLPGFEETELVSTAPYLGIRESRRIECDYRLVLDDFIRQAVFDDEIGRYAYNIDIHSSTNDQAGYENFMKEHTTFCYKDGESYGIPYRALTVKGIDNLLTAGRCIGSDRYMQSSVRVMPGCYITGQAAGIAAAVVCDAHGENVHEADVREIQKRLVKIGGYLPNFRS